MEILTYSAEQTKNVAKDLAKKLKDGDVIALYGNLGSGKTTFVQGLAEGLKIKDKVQSPTFVIQRIYSQKPKLIHIDLYRIENEKDIEDLGFEDFLGDKNCICVIEWPEKMEKILPKNTMIIKFEYLSENERRIKVGK